MARWQFQPRWWAVLGTMAGCALTISLGVWQLHRGQDKQALQDRYDAVGGQAEANLSADNAARKGEVQRAMAQGRYLEDRQLLLDNQTREREPGYEVWTPLRLHNGGLVIVNRGWFAGGGDRNWIPGLPAPQGDLDVHGLWRTLPEPGMRVKSGACSKALKFPVLVNYPTAAEIACLLGEPVADGVLLLDPQAPGGYVREWRTVSEFPPQRHYAYAAQWFAFAATLLFFFIKLNLKKQP